MRFAILRKADNDTEAGMLPTAELISAIGQYIEDMGKAGILLAGEGLKPTSQSARMKFSGGKPTVQDGPFTETKELIAGYTVIDVASREEALAWMKRWPQIDGGGEVELELRPMYEAEDFGPEITSTIREADERAQARGA
jgi:hypothetical protein